VAPSRRVHHRVGSYRGQEIRPAATRKLIATSSNAIDEWTAEGGVAAAKHDLTIVAGEIKAGTAAAQRIIVNGRSNGIDRVRFTQYGFVAMDVDPDWALRPTGWRIRIHG
jgi:hypothetical protein